MKTLNITTGGHLTSNDDLMLLEGKTAELMEVIFETILRNAATTSYKLYGCQVGVSQQAGDDEEKLTVSKGAIFH